MVRRLAVSMAFLLVAGCGAYRIKKAEFMRADAKDITDPAARMEAMIEADCFAEVGKALPNDPEMIACKKKAGSARLKEAAGSARGTERRRFELWRECFEGGAAAQWSACRAQSQTRAEAEAEAQKASVAPPAPEHAVTSTLAPVITATRTSTSP